MDEIEHIIEMELDPNEDRFVELVLREHGIKEEEIRYDEE